MEYQRESQLPPTYPRDPFVQYAQNLMISLETANHLIFIFIRQIWKTKFIKQEKKQKNTATEKTRGNVHIKRKSGDNVQLCRIIQRAGIVFFLYCRNVNLRILSVHLSTI